MPERRCTAALVLALCLLLTSCSAAGPRSAETAPVELPPLTVREDPKGYSPLPVYLNGLLFARGYQKAGFSFLPLTPFCERAGVSVEWSGDEKSFKLRLNTLTVEGRSQNAYFTASGRYLFAPEGWLIADGELCLPGAVVAKLFSLRLEELGDELQMSGKELSLLEGGTDYYDLNLPEEEVFWLSHIISAEAKGESLEGQIAVGNVVLNRVHSADFPNTVFEVIYDTDHAIQFEPIALGSILEDPTKQAQVAAYLALEGTDIVGDCLYFVNPKYGGPWFEEQLDLAAQIGRHNFYRERG